MKNDVEDLKIYRAYMDLIYYIEMITEKYPKSAKEGIVSSIKSNAYEGIKFILYAYKVYEKKDKLSYLNQLDINLKMMKIFARVSYKKKYISVKNYEAWSRKLNTIGAFLGGWINSCLKQ